MRVVTQFTGLPGVPVSQLQGTSIQDTTVMTGWFLASLGFSAVSALNYNKNKAVRHGQAHHMALALNTCTDACLQCLPAPIPCQTCEMMGFVNCEPPPPLSPCDLNPCLNGATCSNVLDKAVCSCTDSWTGEYCEGKSEILCLLICCTVSAFLPVFICRTKAMFIEGLSQWGCV